MAYSTLHLFELIEGSRQPELRRNRCLHQAYTTKVSRFFLVENLRVSGLSTPVLALLICVLVSTEIGPLNNKLSKLFSLYTKQCLKQETIEFGLQLVVIRFEILFVPSLQASTLAIVSWILSETQGSGVSYRTIAHIKPST